MTIWLKKYNFSKYLSILTKSCFIKILGTHTAQKNNLLIIIWYLVYKQLTFLN